MNQFPGKEFRMPFGCDEGKGLEGREKNEGGRELGKEIKSCSEKERPVEEERKIEEEGKKEEESKSENRQNAEVEDNSANKENLQKGLNHLPSPEEIVKYVEYVDRRVFVIELLIVLLLGYLMFANFIGRF